ncbi:MAG: hypothetical protein AAGF11_39740 [Myxococcota bacterium]
MRTAAATATATAAPSAGPAPTKGKAKGKARGRAKAKTPSSTSGDANRERKRDDASGRTVIEDEFLVEGKLEKPSAYYILRRSSLDYDWARLDAKFSPLVLESVQDPLF